MSRQARAAIGLPRSLNSVQNVEYAIENARLSISNLVVSLSLDISFIGHISVGWFTVDVYVVFA